jgi:hypothetical protein
LRRFSAPKTKARLKPQNVARITEINFDANDEPQVKACLFLRPEDLPNANPRDYLAHTLFASEQGMIDSSSVAWTKRTNYSLIFSDNFEKQ